MNTLLPKKYKSIILVFILMVLSGCFEGQENVQSKSVMSAMPVSTMLPVKREVTEWSEFTGRFQPSKRVEVRARVSGHLEKIKFQDGQTVKKGDVLFVIDQRPFQISLNDAKAKYELAQHRFERIKSLHSKQAVSKDQYEQRRQEMQTALAGLERDKLNLEFTQIKAPISGRVSRKKVDEGNLVIGGDSATVLTTIVAVQPIHFYFEGSESDFLKYSRIKGKGRTSGEAPMPLSVFVKLQDENDFLHEGQIDFVDNEFDAGTGTILARARFDNADGFLEAGYFGRLRVAPHPSFEALLVPDTLIGTEQTRKFVYVVGFDNIAIRKYLKLGALEKDGLRIIKQGLGENDQVITGNLNMVRPGVFVTDSLESSSKSRQTKKG